MGLENSEQQHRLQDGGDSDLQGVLRTCAALRVSGNIPDFLSVSVVGLSSCLEEWVEVRLCCVLNGF